MTGVYNSTGGIMQGTNNGNIRVGHYGDIGGIFYLTEIQNNEELYEVIP